MRILASLLAIAWAVVMGLLVLWSTGMYMADQPTSGISGKNLAWIAIEAGVVLIGLAGGVLVYRSRRRAPAVLFGAGLLQIGAGLLDLDTRSLERLWTDPVLALLGAFPVMYLVYGAVFVVAGALALGARPHARSQLATNASS